MDQSHVFTNFADLLTQVEQKRQQFQAEIKALTGVDFRVCLTVHSSSEPHAQQLVDAAGTLEYRVDIFRGEADSPERYDCASNYFRPGEGIVLFGPDYTRAD